MEDFLKALFSGAGVAGLILGFHLWKLAPELRSIWRAIDRNNRVRILGIIAAPHIAPEVKNEAASLIRELDDEAARARKREIIPP